MFFSFLNLLDDQTDRKMVGRKYGETLGVDENNDHYLFPDFHKNERHVSMIIDEESLEIEEIPL
jgi:hypothetical protein